ncbi:MFS transporter [Burkholderia diffusa]|uniref:MFS transporter n=1 Tax=Burkholderia diffusa TaxID=488732 RepID=UPI000A887197|nr:MFS transporter [Burkholderia diffusa]
MKNTESSMLGELSSTSLETSGAVVSGYRWIILLLCWGTLLLSFVDRLTWGTVAPSAGAAFGLSVGALGIFVTAFYIGYVISNVAGGIAVDWLGARLIIALSMLPLGLCTYLFGHTTSIAYGVAVQALMGLAAGCDYSACVKLISTWFGPTHRGRAMGLLMTATSLAVMITNALVPKLMKVMTWGDIYAGLGLATSMFGLLSLVVLREGPISRRTGYPSIKLAALVRNRDLVLLTLAGFGGMWGTWGFAFWGNALMIKRYGITVGNAGYVMALAGIGAVVSKPLIGLVSDWIGGRCKALIIGSFVVFSALLLVFGGLERDAQFYWVAPFIGVAAFAWSPLIAIMVARAAGSSLAGSATGITNGFWQLGNVIVPLVVGAVFQSTHSFSAAFVTLAAGPLLAALCMRFTREVVPGRVSESGPPESGGDRTSSMTVSNG